jgi:heat shock protein HslJ
MGGSDDGMHAESVYFELLQKTRKYTMNKTTFTLSDAANRHILIFQAHDNNLPVKE